MYLDVRVHKLDMKVLSKTKAWIFSYCSLKRCPVHNVHYMYDVYRGNKERLRKTEPFGCPKHSTLQPLKSEHLTNQDTDTFIPPKGVQIRGVPLYMYMYTHACILGCVGA